MLISDLKLFSVAIGESYEIEAQRLNKSLEGTVEIFTKSNPKYQEFCDDALVNGLWHKCNFANYIDEATGPVIFLDADMFTLSKKPFKDFSVDEDVDFAYVPYLGKWHLPDQKRQEAIDHFGHKINSGFMYFKNLEVAKKICNLWQYEYRERKKIYDTRGDALKYEYDEYALMIALMKTEIKTHVLDKKWNDFSLSDEKSFLSSESIFFQSHGYLDII